MEIGPTGCTCPVLDKYRAAIRTRPDETVAGGQTVKAGKVAAYFGLRFTTEDVIEVHHWDGNRTNNRYRNLVLLHGHCHDEIHGKRY